MFSIAKFTKYDNLFAEGTYTALKFYIYVN